MLTAALPNGVAVAGDDSAAIDALAPIDAAAPGTLTHLSSRAYRRHLPQTRASAVLLREADASNCPTTALVVDNPYLAFAIVSRLFDDAPRQPAGIHPSAHVDSSARVHATAAVGPCAVVGADAVLAARTAVGAGACIGEGVRLGEGTVVHANATLCHGVRVGRRCVVHSGAVIGADGFGFTPDRDGRLQAIAQLGGVAIGDDVCVGAGTAIDRGTIADTVIRDGVKIDNLVQIGHNCDIGEHTLICGCVGIVGSTKVGRHCVLAGGAGIAGDGPVELADGVWLGAVPTARRSIPKPGVYQGGILHDEAGRWKRNAMRFGQLDDLAKRVARLEALAAGASADAGRSGGGRDRDAVRDAPEARAGEESTGKAGSERGNDA